MRFSFVITTALVLVACEKSNSPTAATQPDPDPQRQPSSTTAPPTSAPASASASTPESASASAPPAATASPPPAPALVSASKDAATNSTSVKPVTKHVAGNNFALDLASPGCKAGAECTMTIKLAATADYHINKEYPYKFIAAATPGLEFLGKPEATMFTRAAGDFVEQGEKLGTMTIRFKPSSPGDATIAGTYKFSICSADQCQIEQEKLDLKIPIL